MEHRPLKPKIKLSKISVPVPRSHQLIDSCEFSHLDFVSDKSVQSDLGIGAGQFCIRRNNQQMIRGSLSVKIGWKGVEGSNPELSQNIRIPRKISRDSQFDPMNPDQENPPVIIKETTHDQSDEEIEEEEFFFNEDELAFCSIEEWKNNPRNRILSERAKNNLKYKDFKCVPFDQRQLVDEDNEPPVKLLDETLGMDPIDLQRYKGKKYLLDVYSKISNYCKSLNEASDENVLLMENMPTMASLIARFFDLFGPNRPLKPARRPTSHRVSSRNVEVSQFQISINIIRAFGIPQRQDESLLNTRKSSNMSSPKESGYRPVSIRPFVTASFGKASVRTSTADGVNPTWNEQMTIPLK